jgi:ankyrin repeat protein
MLGADPAKESEDGSIPLLIAAQKGHIEVIRELGKLGANPNTPRVRDGVRPMLGAAAN